MKVLVVESPAKAKTINKYLGRDFEVVASFGHIRDLPSKDGSVDPDDDFRMKWELDARGAKQVAEIAKAVKGAEKLILATDPDREGEAISWHLLETLRDKKALKGMPVERVTFNAITKQSVEEALKAPRQIDQALVDAYLARRALDYLVGFNLSPVLWRKLPGARSAGRVQSVALRIVSDREREIEMFVPREYWSIVATLKTKDNASFEARLVGADGKRIQRLDVGTAAEAEAFKHALESAVFTVASVEAKPAKRNPAPPFTTSTLQQEASRKLGFAPARTMQLAQRLYEGVDIGGETVGLITYMRTDGVDMDPSAVTGVRKVIEKEFGGKYLPDAPRKYTTKAKNAQEAHEAIRPTDASRLPAHLRKKLDDDQWRLYELIWTRTVASQMPSADLMRTTVDIDAKANKRIINLRATGQVIMFDGFLTLYQEGKDDEGDDEDANRLPPMSEGDPLKRETIDIAQHFTEPPPRYSEASLVKRMEELGIGRPSTYASIISVLKDRDYVALDKKRLVPQDKGRIVTAFLEHFFPKYVEYDFTAGLEEELDKISADELNWQEFLRRFWKDFSSAVGETKELRTTEVLDALNDYLGAYIFPKRADGVDPRACPNCGNGQLSLKMGKFGAFIGCSNYPECRFTRQLTASAAGDEVGTGENGQNGVRKLGVDPESGLEVTVRDGRFGPYLQLGEGGGKDEKPKRSSLPKGITPDTIDLERALKLLSLPREVAKHPESGKPILAGIGRYGPYVQHEKTYANIGKDDDILEIGDNRAIDLIITKEQIGASRPGRGGAGRPLGEAPGLGQISAKAGRYGPYVTNGKINATLPKEMTAEAVTLEEAIAVLKARAENGGGKEKGVSVGPNDRLLGNDDVLGTLVVKAGRFGAYVTNGKVNATIPKSMAPDQVSLQDAIDLVRAREASAPAKKPAKAAKKAKAGDADEKPAAKAPAKKAPASRAPAKTAKTSAAKKPPAKKAAAKKVAKK
ncbi:type I DNA topoisomerase [Terrarubrum flagellatum]|uniref:type I DNA topoisomerase n=1 Tax=Terrirubrum flagellatum TaxID=2895980 RepID=UPI0031453AF2